MMYLNVPATLTDAYSVVPYNPGYESAYTFITRFGDQVAMAKKSGNTLWVPRQTVPVSSNDTRVRYKDSAFAIDCSFEPVNDEQSPLAEQCISLLKKGVDHVFEAPTGWGKSVVGGYIAARMGVPTLIVVTKEDLMDSWYDALVNVLGVSPSKVGKVQQNTCQWEGKQFVIGMVHSLVIPDRYPTEMYRYFGMMILDEVHQMAADTFVEVCWKVPAYHRLGFSATPDRSDGKWELIKAHVGATKVRGTLVPMAPKVLVKQTGWRIPEKNGVKIPYSPGRMMTVTKAQVNSAARNLHIVEFAVSAHRADRNLLILSDTLDHLDFLFQTMTSMGVPGDQIGYYVGGMSKIELDIAKKKKVVLGTYKMCSTGTNVPAWDCIVLATPKANVKQSIGRVLRHVAGKKQPVIFDLVDQDSIFNGFYLARLKQYYAIGATIIQVK